MSGKRKESNNEVHGAPDIAPPSKRHRAFIRALLLEAPPAERDRLKVAINELLPYEKQVALVYAWFFKMIERVESSNDEAGKEARCELQTLLLNTIGQVLRIAQQRKQRTAKKWAGKFLASIGKSVGKHHEKLCKGNKAYRLENEKIGSLRRDVLFPHSPVTKVVQRELKRAERYRKRLKLLSVIPNWEKAAKRRRIPKEYWPLRKFPEFSAKEKPFKQWWKFLWRRIQKKIDLSKMKQLKLREYDTVKVSMRKGGNPEVRESEKKFRKRYLSDIERIARDHLKVLGQLGDAHILC